MKKIKKTSYIKCPISIKRTFSPKTKLLEVEPFLLNENFEQVEPTTLPAKHTESSDNRRPAQSDPSPLTLRLPSTSRFHLQFPVLYSSHVRRSTTPSLQSQLSDSRTQFRFCRSDSNCLTRRWFSLRFYRTKPINA